MLGLVARDQTGVDGADRRADDPIRLDPRLMQGLIDARLVGAERAAALKDKDDLHPPCAGLSARAAFSRPRSMCRVFETSSMFSSYVAPGGAAERGIDAIRPNSINRRPPL